MNLDVLVIVLMLVIVCAPDRVHDMFVCVRVFVNTVVFMLVFVMCS